MNIGTAGSITFRVPEDGLVDAEGNPAPKKVRLQPKDGCVFASPSLVEPARPPATDRPLLVLAGDRDDHPPDWFELYGNARIDQGQFRLPTRAGYVDSVVSRPSFRACGRGARTRLEVAPSQPSAETFLELRTVGGDFVAIGKSGDQLMLRLQWSGQRSDRVARFDPLEHRWWNLRVGLEHVHWQTSGDGITWRTERMHTGTDFSSARVKMVLVGGHYESNDADEEAVFGVVRVIS